MVTEKKNKATIQRVAAHSTHKDTDNFVTVEAS
jgi:hypothetical protein